MKLLPLDVVVACVPWLLLANCATTGAYVQKHPEHADEVAIAQAAIECVDQAGANLVFEESAETILAQALACAANLFSGVALDATEEAVSREIVKRQVKTIRTLRIEQIQRANAIDPSRIAPDLAVPHDK